MKILLVDDSGTMRAIQKRCLFKLGVSEDDVVEAENGQTGLEEFDKGGFDIVLTDWNMPEMTGIELLHALKEKEIQVKVGVVTSQGTAEMQAQAKDAGALFLLAKPFTADTFREALEPVM